MASLYPSFSVVCRVLLPVYLSLRFGHSFYMLEDTGWPSAVIPYRLAISLPCPEHVYSFHVVCPPWYGRRLITLSNRLSVHRSEGIVLWMRYSFGGIYGVNGESQCEWRVILPLTTGASPSYPLYPVPFQASL